MTQKSDKLTIAVDIDDVLFPFIVGVAEFYNQRHGANLKVDDYNNYNIVEVWGCSLDDARKIVDEFLASDHGHLAPIEGSIAAVNQLKKHFRVVSLTARNDIFEVGTTTWLKQHFPDLFDGIYFAGSQHDGRPFRKKGEICREIGADILIDDSPDNLASAVEHGVDGVLFGKRPWSVMGDLPESHVKHCANWQEVEDYIYNDWQPRQL